MEMYQVKHLESIPNFINEEINTLLMQQDVSDVDFLQKSFNEISDKFKEQFSKYFCELINAKQVIISSGWVNFTKHVAVDNSFDWHNENGIGGDHFISINENICTFWIDGEKDKGGDFKYMTDNNITVVKFNPPSFMVMSKDTLHAVEAYYGTKFRISFNFNFEQK